MPKDTSAYESYQRQFEGTIHALVSKAVNDPEAAKRDWAAFFQALIQGFIQLAPIILPLFLKKEVEPPTNE